MTTATISQRDKTFISEPVMASARCNDVHVSRVLSANEQRSLALAARYGATAGAARFYVGTRSGREIYRVTSRHNCTTRYDVTYNPATDTVEHCTCEAQHGYCWHRGVTLLKIGMRKLAAEIARRQAECEWMAICYDGMEG